MQHHVSYKKEAVIENPLHFILLIKLLIMPFFSQFYFFRRNLSTFFTLRRMCDWKRFGRKYIQEIDYKPVAKHFLLLSGRFALVGLAFRTV